MPYYESDLLVIEAVFNDLFWNVVDESHAAIGESHANSELSQVTSAIDLLVTEAVLRDLLVTVAVMLPMVYSFHRHLHVSWVA